MVNQLDKMRKKGLDYLNAAYGEEAVETAIGYVTNLKVEVPGWQFWAGFGGGGRFEGGNSGGAARNTLEIAEDAGLVYKLTNATPWVGQHILWFLSTDGLEGDVDKAQDVLLELEENGVKMGSISPTYFLKGSEDGSLSPLDPKTMGRYIDHTVLGAKFAAKFSDNHLLTLWLPDGTLYPGQRDLDEKVELVNTSLATVASRVKPNVLKQIRVLTEYKVFEPGTFSTTIPDWGTAYALSQNFGKSGGVLVDLGHHHHSVNIGQIVSTMITFGIMGGFHFNKRYAADDDHSCQADYELAQIFDALVKRDALYNKDQSHNWTLALDQMARTEERIPSILKSIDALQLSVAKPALLNRGKLREYQEVRNLINANVEYERALLHADTRPIVMEAYHKQGLHPVPMVAYAQSGYQKRIGQERAKPLK